MLTRRLMSRGAAGRSRWSFTLPLRAASLLAAILVSASAVSAGEAPQAVVLQLGWLHQATSGGFYAAEQKGLYAGEGIKLSYLEGGPKIDQVAAVVEGRAQFGVTGAGELLVARQLGKPVRAIAVLFRRSPIVYITKADSGITTPEHFVGKTIRVSPVDSVSLKAMMARLGIAPDRYHLVSLPSDLDRFRTGEADVWTFYVNGFAIVLERAGVKVNKIYPDDYGVHFYADTLFTTDEMVSSRTDLVLRFLRASLKGWEIAVEDPRLIGPLVKRYDPKADAADETLKIQATQTLVNTGEDRIGWMRATRWAAMAKMLQEQGVLSGPVDVNQVHTLAFLQQIYGTAVR